MKSQTVLAFGTFDGIHPGHEHFLSEAAALGSKLVVGVARDEHVRKLKNKSPNFSHDTRRDAVAELSYVEDAVLSDENLGSYDIIDTVNPDVIAIGHDQIALLNDLRRWMRETGREITTKRISKK